MQAIWKGAISFGLVTIPVGWTTPLRTANRASYPLRRRQREYQVQTGVRDRWRGGPLRRHRQGVRNRKGSYVVFSDEELDSIGKALSGTVDVVQFGDPRHRPHLLQEVVLPGARQDRVEGLSEFVAGAAGEGENRPGQGGHPGNGKYLATLRAEEDVLVLETMWWPDEIREPRLQELDTEVDNGAKEMQMAALLIDNLATTFDPSAWTDASREAVEEMARRKAGEGREIVAPSTP